MKINRRILILLLVLVVLLGKCTYDFVRVGETSKVDFLVKNTKEAEIDLSSWIISAQKKGKSADNRQVDTDGNGTIDNGDMTNRELLSKGICNQYVLRGNKFKQMKSPWDYNTGLWTTSPTGKGQIACEQLNNTINLTAFDSEAKPIYKTKITSNGIVHKKNN